MVGHQVLRKNYHSEKSMEDMRKRLDEYINNGNWRHIDNVLESKSEELPITEIRIGFKIYNFACNCFAYAFNLHESRIYQKNSIHGANLFGDRDQRFFAGSNFAKYLIKNKLIEELSKDDIKRYLSYNDLKLPVIYFKDDEPTHAGILIKYEPGAIIIKSVWGGTISRIFTHKLEEVPESYGNTKDVKYYIPQRIQTTEDAEDIYLAFLFKNIELAIKQKI